MVDLDIPEIKDMLKTPVPPGTVCHDKFGWLPSNLFDQVRKLIDDEATATAVALHGMINLTN
jgi:hypothetical protein